MALSMDMDGVARELAGFGQRPIDSAILPVELPSDDAAELSGDELGWAEGQSFMIEYTDAAGQSSRRRITVFQLQRGSDEIPLLLATCHEREATRSFRVDRIGCCIDLDGEVHENVADFLADAFGMSDSWTRTSAIYKGRRWDEIVAAIGADAVLLAAMARIDMRSVKAEKTVAMTNLHNRLERANITLDNDEQVRLERFVSRLRPDVEAIRRAIEEIGSRGAEEIKLALLASARVMTADGKRHPREVRLLNVMAMHWLGRKLL